MTTKEPKYSYRAQVIDVIDGDTIRCNVDLGFSVWSKLVFRLYGLNTPELVGKDKTKALEAKNFLIAQVLNKQVTIKTHKDRKEKYGRYLAEILNGKVNINKLLLDKGLAVKYMI